MKLGISFQQIVTEIIYGSIKRDENKSPSWIGNVNFSDWGLFILEAVNQKSNSTV